MKIKKFDDKKTEKEQDVLFTAKSLEKNKDEKPSFKTSIEDQEKVEKEFKKSKDKIEKFESFITINIDHVDNIECENEYEVEDDSEFDCEYEESEISGCGCCDNCTGEESCNYCSNCKCGGDENIQKASEFVNTLFSESLKYHLENNKPITENIFRPGSEAFFNVIKEARQLFDSGKVQLCDIDKELYESTEIGNFAYFNGELAPLDLPMVTNFEIYESKYGGKKVKLNKPMRSSGPKKYKVYVKNPKTGKIIKVNFGDLKGGLTSKIGDPEARRRFDKRHGCSVGKHEDKTKAGYWSCRLPRYAKLLGLSQVSAKWW